VRRMGRHERGLFHKTRWSVHHPVNDKYCGKEKAGWELWRRGQGHYVKAASIWWRKSNCPKRGGLGGLENSVRSSVQHWGAKRLTPVGVFKGGVVPLAMFWGDFGQKKTDLRDIKGTIENGFPHGKSKKQRKEIRGEGDY